MIAAENAKALVCHGIWLWATACCSAAAVRQMAEKQSTELITEALVSSRSYLWPCIRFVPYCTTRFFWCGAYKSSGGLFSQGHYPKNILHRKSGANLFRGYVGWLVALFVALGPTGLAAVTLPVDADWLHFVRCDLGILGPRP